MSFSFNKLKSEISLYFSIIYFNTGFAKKCDSLSLRNLSTIFKANFKKETSVLHFTSHIFTRFCYFKLHIKGDVITTWKNFLFCKFYILIERLTITFPNAIVVIRGVVREGGGGCQTSRRENFFNF